MVSRMLANPHDVGQRPSPVPRLLQQIGIGVFVVGFIAASGWAVTDHWRRATFVLGASMLWLTVLRLLCDSAVLGILAVRSRKFDCAFTTALGGLLVFLALSVDALGSG